MTQAMEEIIIKIRKLSPEEQDALAQVIAEAIEEHEWNVTFSKPHVMETLKKMAQQALNDHAVGDTIEGGFGEG